MHCLRTGRPARRGGKIKHRLGCYGACVADVNDLKRSAVLGYSKGLHPQEIAKILIDNPFGNASQKTPVVIIKNYGAVARNRRAEQKAGQ